MRRREWRARGRSNAQRTGLNREGGFHAFTQMVIVQNVQICCDALDLVKVYQWNKGRECARLVETCELLSVRIRCMTFCTHYISEKKVQSS